MPVKGLPLATCRYLKLSKEALVNQKDKKKENESETPQCVRTPEKTRRAAGPAGSVETFAPLAPRLSCGARRLAGWRRKGHSGDEGFRLTRVFAKFQPETLGGWGF